MNKQQQPQLEAGTAGDGRRRERWNDCWRGGGQRGGGWRRWCSTWRRLEVEEQGRSIEEWRRELGF
ncbi:hypothetical protein Hanom_Chr14g01334291 [Helianthus anomalus]